MYTHHRTHLAYLTAAFHVRLGPARVAASSGWPARPTPHPPTSLTTQIHQRGEPRVPKPLPHAEGHHQPQLQQASCRVLRTHPLLLRPPPVACRCAVESLPACCTMPTAPLARLAPCRWAADAAAIWDFREQPPWQWPLTRSIMFASGQCGLDKIEEPSAGSGAVPGCGGGLGALAAPVPNSGST